jgi:UDP-N-acetylmuramyl pentapeptide synthase
MVGPIAAGNKTSFGFSPDADFRASDVHVAKALNFKANVKGNIIPVWLNRATTEEQVFSALAAMTVGRIFGLNLIQTTQAIKDFCPAP